METNRVALLLRRTLVERAAVTFEKIHADYNGIQLVHATSLLDVRMI
jgi:hypothetical protein